MKKLLSTLGIITVLVLGMAICVVITQDIKHSIQDYVINDLVQDPEELVTRKTNNKELKNTTPTPINVEQTNLDLIKSLEATKEEIVEETSQETTEDGRADIMTADEKDTGINGEEETTEVVETALNIKNPSIAIDAASAILMDDTGKVLFYKNPTESIYPASTTKLVTALVALDVCELDDQITVGNEIDSIEKNSSRANLEIGQKLTLQMLLEGMLIPSGNDAAYSIAAYIGRISLDNRKASNHDAIQEFVRLMNAKVEELGLRDTCFKNPDGYDEEGQYTTAYDMGIIAMAALSNKDIREIAGKSKTRNTFLSGEDVTWYSTNKLIMSDSGRYYSHAIGLKTGSSSLAGSCLVSAARKDDHTYISVVMNSTPDGRWEDSIDLLSYGVKGEEETDPEE